MFNFLTAPIKGKTSTFLQPIPNSKTWSASVHVGISATECMQRLTSLNRKPQHPRFDMLWSVFGSGAPNTDPIFHNDASGLNPSANSDHLRDVTAYEIHKIEE